MSEYWQKPVEPTLEPIEEVKVMDIFMMMLQKK